MAGNANPYRDSFPWSNILVGGMLIPGIIQSVDGCSKAENWVYQRGLAASNAVSIWRGRSLAETIKIITRVYNEATFDACFALRDILRPNWRRPPVLPVMNGHMNFAGITRVSLKEIYIDKAYPDISWDLAVILTEFNPLKAVPVGPADPPHAETENDRLAKQLDDLVGKAAKYPFP